MFAGKKSAQIREILISESAWEEMTCLFAPSLAHSRWRCFSRVWIANTKGDSLDISWLKDSNSVDAAGLPEPDILARAAKEELEAALSELSCLLVALEGAE